MTKLSSFPSNLAHIIHCFTLLVTVIAIIYHHRPSKHEYDQCHNSSMINNYGFIGSILVTCVHFAPLPPLIITFVFTFSSFVLCNCFNNHVKSSLSPENAPFICFRTVTRGYFPKLVKYNASRNKELCLSMGLKHFQVEIVTDVIIDEWKDVPHIKQTVVPTNYRTPKGTLFKARALQYALEDHVNTLANEEWIVHLDEETLLTCNSINGILNFVCNSQYPIGQGIITYANENVINWFTTFLDCYRVGDDMGKLRTQLQFLHFLVTDWKGSYLVCQKHVEKSISFDHGPGGSLSEDTHFGLKAASKGYPFNFIEGEMWEKSPFTLLDYLKQRKRWMEGSYCIAFDSSLPFRRRIIFIWMLITMFLMQGLFYIYLCNKYLPLNCALQCIRDICISLIALTFMYIHVIGAVKSYMLYPKFGLIRLALFVLGFPIAVTINGTVASIFGIMSFFTKKSSFGIVNKDYEQVFQNA